MVELLTQSFVQHALISAILMGLILAYLGVHVVRRGIVFVDLALGQISMLGVAVAHYFEMEPFTVSIFFTLTGAFFLSLINVKDPRLKSEALIGIVYAFTSALTVLFISKSPHGDSDISEVLFGSLFTVTDTQIITMLIMFGMLALLHFIFRKKFFETTDKIQSNSTIHIKVFDLWNFLFYLSIGLTIVLAVQAGGVIPVFSYLIIPAVSAILLARRASLLVIFALVISVVGSILGIYFSIEFDFPAGSSIVTILGILFFIAGGVSMLKRKATP